MGQRLCPVIVGRDSELATLRDALDSALRGNARSVVIAGEPGIGKSRLGREVAQWAGDRGATVTTGRSVPSSTSTPYRPLTEALLQLLRDGQLPDDPAVSRWIPLLEPVLPMHVRGRVAPGDEAASLRGEAVLQLLLRIAPDGLVLVLEDLHWADPDTVSVLEYLADNLRGSRVLLVMTMRDSSPSAALDMARRQRGRSGAVFMTLDRLTGEQLAAMVRACEPQAPDDVIDRVQEASDGVPLLVEELLASPGLPEGFTATVRARLDDMETSHRHVIETAAVLGRHFDWELLAPITGHRDEVVSTALVAGVDALLLSSQGTALRFRHALTREAVLGTIIPPRQRQLAEAALAAVSNRELSADQRDLVIDLSLRAGDRCRAGGLLHESGSESLRWGALATAAETLQRAAKLLEGAAEQADAELELVEALALAGRSEEAAAVGGRLMIRLGPDPSTAALRVEVHLRLAQAAVAAARWQMARHHLEQVRSLAGSDLSPRAAARAAVLEADVLMASDDHETARDLAESILHTEGATPDIRCHAFEIVGRSRRPVDLAAARSAFEDALITAEAADLPLWRLRALHELGTIDLFNHAGVERLLQARQAAEQMGAVSTAAILDLQLAAAFTCRWDLDACDMHAHSAIEIAERLRLDLVRAKAFSHLTGSAGMRADPAAAARYAALAVTAAPGDKMLEGFSWAMRGMSLLLAGEEDASIEPYARGMAILGRLPHAEPAAVRALWPLVLASRGDERAQRAIDEARRLGVGAFDLNRGMIHYAEAVLAGRRGDHHRARELVAAAAAEFSNCDGWADLARFLAAPVALEGGWAGAQRWLTDAADGFALRGLPALAERCHELLRQNSPNPWRDLGISTREADVLRLLVSGLANKEIASALHLSPRTIEKHVESLLRKTGTRSRTELAARLAPGRLGSTHSLDTT